jgi:group I intron endonuclease
MSLDEFDWLPITCFPKQAGFVVYAIKAADSGKVYVGSTSNLSRRLSEHRHKLKVGSHVNKRLTIAYELGGLESLKFAVLECCNSDNAMARETFWIKSLDAFKNGLNQSPEADGTGRPVTDETRRKIGNTSRGRIASEETRRLISIASKNQPSSSRKAAGDKKRGRKRMASAVVATAIKNRGQKRTSDSVTNISKSLVKLTLEQMFEVRSLALEGMKYQDIATQFGVSKQTVCNIRHGKQIYLKRAMEEMDKAK